MSDIQAINIDQMAEEALANILANTVAYFKGSPGIGKSGIISSLANKLNLELIDIRLAAFVPEDINGIPIKTEINGKNVAEFIPFNIFPLKNTPIPEGKKGWLIFLDELSSAPKAIQAAIYKLILDRQVGNHKLHKNVRIIAAGNKDTDKAIVNPLSTALISRMVNYTIDIDSNYTEHWIEWAFKNKIDPSIIGYLSWRKSAIMTFDPNMPTKPFASPRSWEMVSKHLQSMSELSKFLNKEINISDLYYRILGTIGDQAVEFIAFIKAYAKLPDIKEIINDPKSIELPSLTEYKFSTISYLSSEAINYRKHIDKIVSYVKRFKKDPEFIVLFARMVLQQDITFRNEPAIANILDEFIKIKRAI